MRNRYLIALCFLLLLVACKNETGFINHEKWKVPERPGQGYLKGHPKQVKESYFNMNDTTIYGEGKKNSEEVYRFDEQGNIMSGYILIDSSLYSEFMYLYSDEGRSYNFQAYRSSAKDSLVGHSWITAKKIVPGQFLLTKYSDSQKSYHEYHTFNGNTVKVERGFPTGEKFSVSYWYDNNRLVKTVEERKDTKNTNLFFYNRNGFLDSIVQRGHSNHSDKDHVPIKQVFVNNEYGDPITTYSLNGADTTEYERNSYLYDKKGNWVRRLNFLSDSLAHGPLLIQKYPLHKLSVREITY